MARDFEKGQRERFNLILEEFNHFFYEHGSGGQDLFSHEESRPVNLQCILTAMGEIYSRERQEYLGAGLETNHSAVLTLFEPEGVWVLEYHDEDRIKVQLKETDRERFLREVDSRFTEELYEEMGIDPEDIVHEGKQV